MKVFFIFENFDIGGVERIYINLSNYFFQNYRDIDVYLLVENKEEGILLSQILSTGKILEFNKSYRCFNEILNTFNPEILFLTKGYLMKYALYSKLFGRYRDFKIIISLHNPLNIGFISLFTKIKRILGSMFFYRLATAVVTISETMKEEILRYTKIKNDKVKVIYNPIINDDIKYLSEEFVDIDYDYVVAVGRLHFQKGYEYMIEIFEDFLKKYDNEFKNLKLLILGDGPERNRISKLIVQKNLTDRIILCGNTLNPYKFIKNAKGILLTSRYEGFPTVLVEALFLGTPFVAYDCKYGPKEISRIFNCGYVVPFGNKSLFIESLYKVLKGNKKIDVKDKVNMFNLENCAVNYKQLFEDINRGYK